MKTISRFLCFKLETGAYTVAVFCMVLAFLSIFYSFSIVNSSGHEDHIRHEWTENGYHRTLVQRNSSRSEFTNWTHTFNMLGQAVIIIIYALFVLGLLTHDVKLMIPAVVICAFSVFMYPLSILNIESEPLKVIKSFLLAITLFFCFLILYSTYAKIRDEKSTTRTNQLENGNETTLPCTWNQLYFWS